MRNKRLGRLGILLSLTALWLTSSGCNALSTRAETKPVLIFDEDMVIRTQPNEPCPPKPYPMVHMSVKKFKEYSDPR